MKFKVGDKVRAKSGLIDGRLYGVILYWDDFKDKDFIVKQYDSKDNTYYCLEMNSLFGCEYWLSEEMLEPVYAEGGYVPYNKLPTPEKPISLDEQLIRNTFKDSLDSAFDAWRKLGGETTIYFENGSVIKTIPKEDKPMKFTFYTVDTNRIDKSNNTKVDTITTCVHIGDKIGYATCDKVDYDEREGVINAIANLYCDGCFDKAYRKAVKEKKASEVLDRTCSYCRKVFDTVDERKDHEAWHVERRKARHERYKLRKRAKEIAFEEAAQKLAKEMTGEK